MELVGTPYKDGGRTLQEGFDCYGVVRWVLNESLDLGLPSNPPHNSTWGHYLKVYRQPLAITVQRYDVLMFSELIDGLVNHIAVMVSDTDFIHAGRAFGGVVCEPLSRYEKRILAVGRPHAH